MSSDPASRQNQNLNRPKTCCVWPGIVALVFLRLCVGWHFYSEGIKKVEYDQSRGEWKLVFSSEGFLNQAKGPLTRFYQNKAPTTHNWRDGIQIPRKLDPEKSVKLAAWVESYVKRRQGEVQSGKVSDAQFAADSPTADWAEKIKADWQGTLERFKGIESLTDEQRELADGVLKRCELQLADLMAEEALAIEMYQHNLWRLEQAQSDPASAAVPFEIERVTALRAEVDRTPGQWVNKVKSLDEHFAEELQDVLTAEQKDSPLAGKVKSIVTNPEVSSQRRRDVTITCVVLGVGVLLLLGLFTRVAAIVGALFLLSVMLSQPPWVPEAISPIPYYYQLVELAALLFLAAVGAGKWAGLDFIIQGLWDKCRGTQGA